MMRHVSLLLVAFAVMTQAVVAQGLPPTLDPKTYQSPNGEYQLVVDPSDMEGKGTGTYVLLHAGKKIWSSTPPFTLWDAAVLDDGSAAGYAYTLGYDGDRRNNNYGAIVVAVFEPDGKLRLKDEIPREFDPTEHAPPKPILTGFLVNPVSNRLILRIRGPYTSNSEETWRAYELSTGKRLPDRHPVRSPGIQNASLSVARTIRDTPLTLAEWTPLDESDDAVFLVTDDEGHSIWTLRLPAEFHGDSVPFNPERRLWKEMWGGTVHSTAESKRFQVRLIREKKIATFEVRRSPAPDNAWSVHEIQRTDEPVATSDPLIDLPRADLKHLGTIELDSTHPASSIRNIESFDIDGQDQVGLIRGDETGYTRTHTFLLVDSQGKRLSEQTLPPTNPKTSQFLVAWTGGSRWIITLTTDVKPVNRAYLFDAQSSQLNELTAFTCNPVIRYVAGAPDGGFVVSTEGEFSEDGVIAFDNAGNRKWRRERKHGGPDSLFSPEGVAALADGSTAVICSFNNLIQVYDSAGKHLRSINLKQKLKPADANPTLMARDNRGGFLLAASFSRPPSWRIRSDGSGASAIDPRQPNEQRIALDQLRADSQGRVWISDRDTLMRLDERGIVDRTLGAAPRADAVGPIAGLTLDSKGWIYAVSCRTMVTHVFDADGKRIRELTPVPSDFTLPVSVADLLVAPDGTVFVYGSTASFDRTLSFSADGTRKTGPGPSPSAAFGSSGTAYWDLGLNEVTYHRQSGEKPLKVRRRPDGGWLDQPNALSVAADGSVAVVAMKSSGPTQYTNRTLNLYKSDGTPLKTIPLPGEGLLHWCAYNGHFAVVSLYNELLIVTVETAQIRRFRPALGNAEKTSAWKPFLPPSRPELWLYDSGATQIERFELAENGK